MPNLILKTIVVVLISSSLSGCLTYRAIRHASGGGEEYTTTQISTMSNYGVVQCKNGYSVSEKSRNDCTNDIQARLSKGSMTQEEYSKYESGIDDANASASQKLAEYMQRQQVIDAQQEQQRMDAFKTQQPLDVNVHHDF